MSLTSTAGAVVLALAAAAGAVAGRPVPTAVLVGAGAVALVVVRLGRPTSTPVAVVTGVGLLLLTSSLAHRSLTGLDVPTEGAVEGRADLVSDPEPVGDAVRVELRLSGARVEGWARGPAGGSLRRRLAGESVAVTGRLRAFDERTGHLDARHLAARMDVETVGAPRSGPVPVRLANGLRRLLDRGARVLDADTRSLFAGFVVGDDRFQDPVVADEFRAAGLTHLLAVSGQNVAFLLAVVGPLLRRLGPWSRLAATVAVLAFFALVTRFEPSVLRATAMAGLAAVAASSGRGAESLRLLALAVVGLLLVDPMLVHALAFRLSVGASAGILVLAPPLTRHLPGPRLVVLPMSVTIAAQVGTAPFVLGAFGGIPVASLLANLLAVPLAGPVMVWGLTAGLVAGLLSDAGAALLHLPTRALVGAIRMIAHQVAAWRLGFVDTPVAVVLAALGAVAALAGRRGAAGIVRSVALVGVVILVAVGLAPAPTPTTAAISPGVRLWRGSSGTVLVLGAEARVGSTLTGLRRQRVGGVDALVLLVRSPAVVEVATAVRRTRGARLVVAGGAVPLDGLVLAEPGTLWSVGGVTVLVERVEPTVDVRVGSDRAVGARDPPVRRHHPGRGHGHPQPHPRFVLRQG